MWVLIAIGLVAGLITGVSPCVLPVLPVVFFAGDTTPAVPGTARRRFRPAMIILGLVAGFSMFTLLGFGVLTALHLPADFLRWAGLVILVLVGLGQIFPPLEWLLQRPFRQLPKAFSGRSAGTRPGRWGGNAFVLGLGVGTLYVPCAGPVLAAISVAGSSGHLSVRIAVLTVAFAVGVGAPLFVFALAGGGISRRISAYRSHSNRFRIAGGAVIVLLACALTFGLTDGLQRTVPSYTQSLQRRVEDNPAARAALAALDEQSQTAATGTAAPVPGPTPATAAVPAVAPAATGPVVACVSAAPTLANCGPAPAIVGIQSWLNTSGNKPLSLAQLRGKVVLVNFWTFSCINCQRTLPFLKAWYSAYHSSGLEIIGVHTPEFAYEHDLGNVQDAVISDGITYPVGLDNTSATWRNFHNSYWPAAYLVDGQGIIRHLVAGEGGYVNSERLIRTLLRAAAPGVVLPAPTTTAVPAG